MGWVSSTQEKQGRLERVMSPEGSTSVRGCNLQQSVSHWERAQQRGSQEDPHVEIERRGDTEDVVWQLITVVDDPRSTVEDDDVLDEAYDGQERAEQHPQ